MNGSLVPSGPGGFGVEVPPHSLNLLVILWYVGDDITKCSDHDGGPEFPTARNLPAVYPVLTGLCPVDLFTTRPLWNINTFGSLAGFS